MTRHNNHLSRSEHTGLVRRDSTACDRSICPRSAETSRTPPHMKFFPKGGLSADTHHDSHGMIVSVVLCSGCRRQEQACKAFSVHHLHQRHTKDIEARHRSPVVEVWI